MTEERSTGMDVLVRYSIFLVAAAASIIISWFGFDWFEQNLKPAEMTAGLKVGTILSQPKALSSINLINTEGKPFTLDNFRGHWTVMAIGYTSCPDVCPTLMATFRAMNKVLNTENTQPIVNFLFVSVDPERDTPEQLGKYVRYFHPNFLGATGKNQIALRELTSQLGLMYARSADSPTSAMGYLIDHSASIALINPAAAWNAVFTPPHDPLSVAEDVQVIINRYKNTTKS